MSNAEAAPRYRRLKKYATDQDVSVRTVHNWSKQHGLKISHIGGMAVIFDDDHRTFIAKFRDTEA